MLKRLFVCTLLAFIAFALAPAMPAIPAPAADAAAQVGFDDEDICRFFGDAQDVCRRFLKFIEANRAPGQKGISSTVFDWLDDNVGSQLQIVDLQQSSASANAEQSAAFQVHVFVVKDDKPLTNQTAGREYQLYVIVLDKENQPVPGAKIDYVVEYVDHRETNSIPQPTNADGIAFTRFRVDMLPTYQMVEVGVLVNANKQRQNAGTAFWGGY